MDLDAIQANGLIVTELFQVLFPNLGPFMGVVSALGNVPTYFVLTFWFYWSVHKSHGKRLGLLLAIGFVFIIFFKHVFQQPRPFWLNPEVQQVAAQGYGFPSGHVTMVTIAALYIGQWLRRRNVWLLSAILIILMGLSRVYLGVHFWYDTIAGFLLGVSILLLGFVWWTYFGQSFSTRILGQRFWFILTISISLAALYIGTLFILNFFDLRQTGAGMIERAEATSLEDAATAFAILIGLSVGFVLESSWVCFTCEGGFWQKSYRFLIGLLVVLVVLFGLGFLFRSTSFELAELSLWLPLALRFIRYALTAWIAAYLAPRLFILIGLDDSEHSTLPNISLNPNRRPNE